LKIAAWRIVKERNAATAFTGEGARLYGGRWNSPGVAMIYTAESRALAALEVLVHLDSPDLLASFVLIQVTFDEKLVSRLAPDRLPSDWRRDAIPESTRDLGDRWTADFTSAVLRVPSVLIPEESNYLLNPAHRDFSRIEIGKLARFEFDPRLIRRR
jgi:RES domain-containing protein